MIKTRREFTTYARVVGFGEKAGVRTVYYSIIEMTGPGARTDRKGGGQFGVDAVMKDNGEPLGKRIREIRRLRGSGPTLDVRQRMSPDEHAPIGRHEAYLWMLDRTGEAGVQALLDCGVETITRADIAAWTAGSERPTTRAMSILRGLAGDPLLVEEEGMEEDYVPAAPEPVLVAPAEPAPAPAVKRSPFTLGWSDADDGLDLDAEDTVVSFRPDRYADIDEDTYLTAPDEDDDDMDEAA